VLFRSPQTALENEAVEEVVETPEVAEEEKEFEIVVEDDTPEDDKGRPRRAKGEEADIP